MIYYNRFSAGLPRLTIDCCAASFFQLPPHFILLLPRSSFCAPHDCLTGKRMSSVRFCETSTWRVDAGILSGNLPLYPLIAFAFSFTSNRQIYSPFPLLYVFDKQILPLFPIHLKRILIPHGIITTSASDSSVCRLWYYGGDRVRHKGGLTFYISFECSCWETRAVEYSDLLQWLPEPAIY